VFKEKIMLENKNKQLTDIIAEQNKII
jgi:hypothetical protein